MAACSQVGSLSEGLSFIYSKAIETMPAIEGVFSLVWQP